MSIYQSLMPQFSSPLLKKLLNWRQSDEEVSWRAKAIDTLSKKLKKCDQEQHRNLDIALDKKCEDTPCVALPRSQDGRLQVSHRKMLPQVMCCRIFRWPDLQSQHEVKSVPRCQYPADRTRSKICVNPYHYVRVEHALYPPVVTPRSEDEFIDASPPPQSPLSPSSTYSQQGSPANYFQQIPQPAHENNNPYNPLPAHTQYPFDQSSYNGSARSQPSSRYQGGGGGGAPVNAFTGYPSQSSPTDNYYVGPNGEPMTTSQMGGGSPQGGQHFDSQTPPPRYIGRPEPQRNGPQLAIVPMETGDLLPQNMRQTEGQEPWCKITYAELNQKLGEPFKSSSPLVYVDGYTNPSIHNHRFSVGTLSNINRNSTIELTRRAIRNGIKLENLDDQIFVTNLSESSIFFHSKNCNIENQLNHHAVVKIQTHKRQKIFDQKVFEGLVQEARMDPEPYNRLFSLTDHCVIKMSFVKGWGSIYQRQDVTSTPCWIDICLLKPYALLDQYLQEARPIHNNITSTS